jgi:DNA polymerase III subunit epsilon
MKNRILFIDTETGGLDPNSSSIISFAAVLWEDRKVCQSMQIFINEDPFFAEPQSLAINNIDVAWLKDNGLSVSDAVKNICEFVRLNRIGPADRFQLAGHNVGFDVGFLKRLFRLGGGDFQALFAHRTIDTSAIVSFLAMSNRINIESPSSSEAFAYFGIEFSPGERHTALGDALATAELYNRLLDTVQRNG